MHLLYAYISSKNQSIYFLVRVKSKGKNTRKNINFFSSEYIVAQRGGRNFESRPWQPIIRVYSPKRVHTGHRDLNESDGSRVTKFARRVPMKNSASLAGLWLVDALRRQRG